MPKTYERNKEYYDVVESLTFYAERMDETL